jgi:hypothetical protein
MNPLLAAYSQVMHSLDLHPEAPPLALQAAVEHGALKVLQLVLDTTRSFTRDALFAFIKTLKDSSEILAVSISSPSLSQKSGIELGLSTDAKQETSSLHKDITARLAPTCY